jgi:flagellar hook assembly protein FlgD
VSFDISIPHASPVSLVVYDSAGRVVHRVADAKFAPGRRVFVWDRRNEDGRNVPSGIYFVRLQAPGALLTQKTVLIQ